jgi:hypothetical protein
MLVVHASTLNKTYLFIYLLHKLWQSIKNSCSLCHPYNSDNARHFGTGTNRYTVWSTIYNRLTSKFTIENQLEKTCKKGGLKNSGWKDSRMMPPHNASGDRMLDTSTPGQISTRTLRHLCETFRYQDKSAPQLDKSAPQESSSVTCDKKKCKM